MNVNEIREIAESACREFNLKRLDVFGYVARGEANTSSDLDLLVEFRDPKTKPAKRFFGLLHSLEDALSCHVDLLTSGSLRNPYFKKRILAERKPVYEG
jgi:hypothetical protein